MAGAPTDEAGDAQEKPRCGLHCANPEPDGALCARRCEGLYLTDLADLPILYAQLGPDTPDQHLLPGAASNGPKVSGSREAPLPARAGALNLRGPAAQSAISRHAIETAAARTGRQALTQHLADQVGQVPIIDALTTIVRELRPYLGSNYRLNHGTIDDQVTAHTVWLERQYDRYRSHPEILYLAEAVRASAHNARTMLGMFDAPIDRKPVPCRCNQLTLIQQPGSDDVECTNPDCQAVYYPADYAKWVTRWYEWGTGQAPSLEETA